MRVVQRFARRVGSRGRSRVKARPKCPTADAAGEYQVEPPKRRLDRRTRTFDEGEEALSRAAQESAEEEERRADRRFAGWTAKNRRQRCEVFEVEVEVPFWDGLCCADNDVPHWGHGPKGARSVEEV